MAQTAPLPPADTPRPLPRRNSSVPKSVRPPRLVPLDGLWMAALAALTAVTAALSPPPSTGHTALAGIGIAALTTAALYLLGWRTRDRATGIIGGLLLATSLLFVQHAAAVPRDALLALLTVGALLSFVSGSSLLALILAGCAALVRPDAVLLGMILLGLALAQRRRRAAWGAALFLGILSLGEALLIHWGYQHGPVLHIGVRGGLGTWALAPGMVFITWMLLPLFAELGEAPRRARWLPLLLWTVSYFAAASFICIDDFAATVFLLLPAWFVLAGGGLSRLLPSLVGEIPQPWVRYLLATIAVVSLLAMRFSAEKPLITQEKPPVTHAPVTSPQPALVLPLTPVRPAAPPVQIVPTPHVVPATHIAPATPAKMVKIVPKPVPKPLSKPVPKPVPKPVVATKSVTTKPQTPSIPLYVHRNGHLVRRSLWAIAWDKAHLGTH